MKNSSILLLIFIISISSFAQKTDKINEFGITTKGLSNFGITYRFGTEKSVWRINAVSSDGTFRLNNFDNRDYSENNFAVGFELGKENRTKLSDKFELRHGLDLGFHFRTIKNESVENTGKIINDFTSHSYRPILNAVLGFNFVFSPSLLLGAEIQPGVSYELRNVRSYNQITNEYETQNQKYINYGFSSNFIRLSVVYRFKKQASKKG